jgi:hypothetical protein
MKETGQATGGGALDREAQSDAMFALSPIVVTAEMPLRGLVGYFRRRDMKMRGHKPVVLPRCGLGISISPPSTERLKPTTPPFVPGKPLRPSIASVSEPLVFWRNRPEPGTDVVVPTPVLGVDANAKDLGFLRARLLDGVAGISNPNWSAQSRRGKA